MSICRRKKHSEEFQTSVASNSKSEDGSQRILVGETGENSTSITFDELTTSDKSSDERKETCALLLRNDRGSNDETSPEDENGTELRLLTAENDIKLLQSRLSGVESLISRQEFLTLRDSETEQDDDDGQPESIHKPMGGPLCDDDDGDSRGIKSRFLTHDTFSFIIISSPLSPPFILGATVFTFQFVAFLLCALSVLDLTEDSTNIFNIPANVGPLVKMAQLIAIVIAVAIQDDIRTGLNLLHERYDPETIGLAFPGLTRWKWLLSITVRVAEGGIGLLVTFLLIVTAPDVVDLLLNFTAMQFVSQLDEVCFFMSKQGFVGQQNTIVAEDIIETEYRTEKGGRSMLRNILLFIIYVILMIGWYFVARDQAAGKYLCSTVFVQFDDDFVKLLGPSSGLYDRRSDNSGIIFSEKAQYIDRQSGKAMFAYCSEFSAWTFTWTEEDGIMDPCINWKARSPETWTFDLAEAASYQWTVQNFEFRQIPLDHFYLSCYDCDEMDSHKNVCGGRGCCSDAVCLCDEGWYGLRCEFHEPCPELKFDVRYGSFRDNHRWSDTFHRFVLNDEPVDVYHYPVYISEYIPGQFDIILFIGRRWVATYSPLLPIVRRNGITAQEALAQYFLDGFHPIWSNLSLAFVSEPMDVGSPENTNTPVDLTWFRVGMLVTPSTDFASFQMPALHDQSDSILLCAQCNNESNPCFYDGVCIDGTCQCAIGSSGALCQTPPVGNGHCDSFYNTIEFEYDGGDCCESTCVSSSEFTCGTEDNGFVNMGYFFCHLPVGQWQLSSDPIRGFSGSLSGMSTKLSNNGATLAIGLPALSIVRVYDKDGSQWVQRGTDIEGTEELFFGTWVGMFSMEMYIKTNSFTTPLVQLAVGTSFTSKPSVYIFEVPGYGSPSLQENLLVFNSDNHTALRMVTVYDMSNNGKIIAAGAQPDPQNSEGFTLGFDFAPLAIFERNISGGWNRRESGWLLREMEFVHSVSLSESGDIIAVGSFESRASSTHPIVTSDARRVYAWNGSNWNERGSAFLSLMPHPAILFNFQGKLVALSDDGDVLALGLLTEGVRVLAWDDIESDWINRGSAIRCKGHVLQGWTLGLSSDGSIVTFGSSDLNPVMESAFATQEINGTVCSFKWNGKGWNEQKPSVEGGYLGSVTLSGDASALAVGLPLDGLKLSGSTAVYLFPTECTNGTVLFRISLTLDIAPELIIWDVLSNHTNETIMRGGPYDTENVMATYAQQSCIPTGACLIFTIYKGFDLNSALSEEDLIPPGRHAIFLDGEEVANGKTTRGIGRYFIGNCLACTHGTHLFQMQIRTCSSTTWHLADASGKSIFSNYNYGKYSGTEIGNCSVANQSTYWEDVCISIDDCLTFSLSIPPVENLLPPLQFRLFIDSEQITAGSTYESTTIPVGDCIN